MKREHLLSVRIDDELLKRIDAWRRRQPDLPSRPEAVRRALVRMLDVEEPPCP